MFQDTSKMSLPQLLCYEAALRDVQYRYYRDRIFGALEAAAGPKPKFAPKRVTEDEGPCEIDKFNARPLSKKQTDFLDAALNMIRSGARNGDDQSGLLSRYRRTLPRQIAATSADHPTAVHMRRAIEIMESAL